jgi:hypothetical protein
VFVVETDDFGGLIARLQRYSGRTPLLASGPDTALFALSSGIQLHLQLSNQEELGISHGGVLPARSHICASSRFERVLAATESPAHFQPKPRSIAMSDYRMSSPNCGRAAMRFSGRRPDNSRV